MSMLSQAVLILCEQQRDEAEARLRAEGLARGRAEKRAERAESQRDRLRAALGKAIGDACACDWCGKPGVNFFHTEGDGSFWLCGSKDGDHGTDRYCGELVEEGDRPFDAARAALKETKP